VDFSAILPRRLLTTRLFSDFLQTDCQLLSAAISWGKRQSVKLCTFQASQGLPKDYSLTPWFAVGPSLTLTIQLSVSRILITSTYRTL